MQTLKETLCVCVCVCVYKCNRWKSTTNLWGKGWIISLTNCGKKINDLEKVQIKVSSYQINST